MADLGALNDLLGKLPIGDIAAKFGVDNETAKSAISQALPALIGGMSANTQLDGGTAALDAALQQHRTDGDLPGLDAIDEEDGRKIVRHVLGDKEDEVARGLSAGGFAGIGGSLLATLAPIVMAYLANKRSGGSGSSGGESGGGIGDILGGLLGGGAGGGLGGMLGGLLGGGDEPEPAPRTRSTSTKKSTKKSSRTAEPQASSGGLGGMLGGLLGKIFGRK